MEDLVSTVLVGPICHLYALLWRLDLLEVDVDDEKSS